MKRFLSKALAKNIKLKDVMFELDKQRKDTNLNAIISFEIVFKEPDGTIHLENINFKKLNNEFTELE